MLEPNTTESITDNLLPSRENERMLTELPNLETSLTDNIPPASCPEHEQTLPSRAAARSDKRS